MILISLWDILEEILFVRLLFHFFALQIFCNLFLTSFAFHSLFFLPTNKKYSMLIYCLTKQTRFQHIQITVKQYQPNQE